MACYIETKNKKDCCGCSSCKQICPKNCITMEYDQQGFYYPKIQEEKCVNCGRCISVCPLTDTNKSYLHNVNTAQVFGGYITDEAARVKSTSGGGFTAMVHAFCDENYAVFGAEMDSSFRVFHSCVFRESDIDKFRRSKYLQSNIGNCYQQAKELLDNGKKVLFSGTPCQIAGLYSYLGGDRENLLTVDLVCHGVPSPKWFHKLKADLENKHKSRVTWVEFRNKDNNHWDNSQMVWHLENGKKIKRIDEPFFRHGLAAWQ